VITQNNTNLKSKENPRRTAIKTNQANCNINYKNPKGAGKLNR